MNLHPSMHVAALLAAAFTVLGSPTATARSQAPAAMSVDAVQARVDAARRELEQLGLAPAPAPALRGLGTAEYVAACAAELSACRAPLWFEARLRLRDAFTLSGPRSPEDLRQRAANELAASSLVRVEPSSGALVWDRERKHDVRAFERDLLRAVVLARRAALTPLNAPTSTEAAALQEALRAGEAELASEKVLEARGEGAANDERRVDALTRLSREAGRAYMLQRALVGGLSNTQTGWDEVPASSEQLLHAAKLHRDRPREVLLPDWSSAAQVAEVVYDDSWGELGLLAMLVDHGVEFAAARAAAVGWDGDRLQIVRSTSGDTALVWRIYFDRPEDTRQFAELWTANATGTLNARLLSVDWVRSDSVAFATALTRVLGATPPKLQIAKEDAESSARIEAELELRRDLTPKLEGSLWSVPALDFSMRVPESWSAEVAGGVAHVFAPQVGDYRDNLSVAEIDNYVDEDFDALLERQKRVIGKLPSMRVIDARKRVVDGRQALHLRYSGQVSGRAMEFASILFVRNERIVAVTLSASAKTWPTLESMIEAAFDTIRVQPGGGAGK